MTSSRRSFRHLVQGTVFASVGVATFACCLFGIVITRLIQDGPGTLVETRTIPVLVLLGLVSVGTVLAAAALRNQLRATRALVAEIRARQLPVPADVAAAAVGSGLGACVDVVDADEVFSFAYGLWSPRVAVSRGLIEACTPEELAAVLEHERCHVQRRDPLRIVVARTITQNYFYVPVLAQLRDRYGAGRELAADRRAIDAHGSRAVAGALYKALDRPGELDLRTAAAMGASDGLAARVEQLETGPEPQLPPVSRHALAITILGGGGLVAALTASLIAFGPVMAKVCGAS
jgi:hypothetical protein